MRGLTFLFTALSFVAVCSGLNVNFGTNSVFEIFGYNSNDIEDIQDYPVVTAEKDDNNHDEPPPHDEVARMARYITHKSDWAAMATIAARDPIVGFPFANIFSVSDGPVDNSSGVPYIYISPWEISAQDLTYSNKASMTMSLAQV